MNLSWIHFFEFFFMALPRVLNGFKFSMLFRTFKRNVPPVSTVSHFCVPIIKGPLFS